MVICVAGEAWVSALCFPARIHVQEQVKRAERQFQSLPQHHQDLLPHVLSNLAQIGQCADHNQEVLQAIVHHSLHMFENMEYGERVWLKSDLWTVVTDPELAISTFFLFSVLSFSCD